MASFGHLYSSYFKAEDFDKKPVTRKIAGVKPEKVGKGDDEKQKLVVYFEGSDPRGLTLNVTRYNTLVELFGTDDVDEWVGGEIQIAQGKTKFQGKLIPCIDIIL